MNTLLKTRLRTIISSAPAKTDPVILDFNTSNPGAGNFPTCTLSSVPANSMMVLTIASASDGNDNPNTSVVSTPGLYWFNGVSARGLHAGNCNIYYGLFPQGGNISVIAHNTGAGTEDLSATLFSIGGSEKVPNGQKNTGLIQSSPSVSITTTRINSLLFCVSSDWSAVAPGTPTYRDSATQYLLDNQSGVGEYVGYHYVKQATSISTYTEGISSPTGMSANTCILEIRGT